MMRQYAGHLDLLDPDFLGAGRCCFFLCGVGRFVAAFFLIARFFAAGFFGLRFFGFPVVARSL
jgi:hypothetical protein